MATVLGVMVDLSGTIHIDHFLIPGSIDALKRLRKAGFPLRFVTNTTKESKSSLLKRLEKLRFDIKEDEIFTSLTAARRYIERKNYRPFCLLEDDAKRDFCGISTEEPNAVLIGLSPQNFNYDTLNKAFRLLLDGSPLVAVHKARYFKQDDGLALGPGPYAAALEYAANTTAFTVGKPANTFFQEVLDDMGMKPEHVFMIGDDVRDDIDGAQKLGIKGILVSTGKYRVKDEDKINPPPFRTCKNFAEAVDIILGQTAEGITSGS